MKRILVIEWKHIGTTVTGTCERCSLTGGAILDVLEELQPYFRQKNVTARFRETVLPDSQIEQSNQVVINGTPLEEYLSGAQVVQTPCCSCACLTGKDEAECRAIDVGSMTAMKRFRPNCSNGWSSEIVESGKERALPDAAAARTRNTCEFVS